MACFAVERARKKLIQRCYAYMIMINNAVNHVLNLIISFLLYQTKKKKKKKKIIKLPAQKTTDLITVI